MCRACSTNGREEHTKYWWQTLKKTKPLDRNIKVCVKEMTGGGVGRIHGAQDRDQW